MFINSGAVPISYTEELKTVEAEVNGKREQILDLT